MAERRIMFCMIAVTLLNQPVNLAIAQASKGKHQNQSLKQGDPMPDYVATNVMNSKDSIIRFSGLRGKFVILDFWATWCPHCIAALPKAQKLQQEFGEEVQFILVNDGESEARIRTFLDKREKLHNLKIDLPIIFNDSVLTGLFHHRSIPHYVWINPAGTVVRMTSHEEVTTENIRAAIDNNLEGILEKKEFVPLRINTAKPFFRDDNGHAENVLYQSIVASQVEGFPLVSEIRANETDGYFINLSGYTKDDLFRFAYGDLDKHGFKPIANSRVLLYDSARRLFTPVSGLHRKDRYIYQLTLPRGSLKFLQHEMRSDLTRCFRYTASKQNVKIKVLALKALDVSRMIYRTGDRTLLISDTEIRVNNVPVQSFLEYFENQAHTYNRLQAIPLVDETNYKGTLGNIEIDADIFDYRVLNKSLVKFGMQLELKESEIEMLVISKVKS